MSISLLLQITFLPCLCWKGAVKLDLAWMLDLLVLIRIVIAFLARERGRGWMIYAGLLYTSPFWIGVLVEWALAK